jgi:hypothetical protein
MKKQGLPFLLLSIFSFLTTVTKAQTTDAEYNYITAGYKIQVIDQGGDIKKGYSILPIDAGYKVNFGSDGLRDVSFMAMYRVGEKKPFAYMMIYKRTQSGFEKYYCIPAAGSKHELWTKTWNTIMDDLKNSRTTNTGIPYSSTVIMALMKFISNLGGRD